MFASATFRAWNVSQTLRPRAFYSQLTALGMQVDSFMKAHSSLGECPGVLVRNDQEIDFFGRILNIISSLPVVASSGSLYFGKILEGKWNVME